MFMVRSEFENIKKLIRVKIKTEQKGNIWFPLISFVIFFVTILPVAVSILRDGSSGMIFHDLTDFSTFFFFGIMFGLVITIIIYRMTNDALSVFPQTNNSRFVASEALNYIAMLCVGLVALILYLLQYGTILLVSVFRENVFFAFEFSIEFIVLGFIAYIMYGFLAVAVFGLLGAIFRKWTYYAVMAFAGLVSLGIVNSEAATRFLSLVFGVLTNEPSFVMFMLKAVVVWLVIFALSFIINRFTVYHRSESLTLTKKVTVICIAVVAVIASLSVVIFSLPTETTVFSTMDEHDADAFIHRFFEGAEEIRIDISHLPRGSDITLTTEGIADDVWAGGGLAITGSRWEAFLGGLDSLYDIQGDTLVIRFRPPFFEVNGIEKMHYVNPRLTVSLDGSNLHLAYEYDTAHVVAISVWVIAQQFEIFKGQGVVSMYGLSTTTSGNMSANINISIE